MASFKKISKIRNITRIGIAHVRRSYSMTSSPFGNRVVAEFEPDNNDLRIKVINGDGRTSAFECHYDQTNKIIGDIDWDMVERTASFLARKYFK